MVRLRSACLRGASRRRRESGARKLGDHLTGSLVLAPSALLGGREDVLGDVERRPHASDANASASDVQLPPHTRKLFEPRRTCRRPPPRLPAGSPGLVPAPWARL